jgi:putative hydrolase of the HAD superfamily
VPRWRAVVLDLDDTLYPEAAYVRSGFRAVAARAQETLGVPAAEAEAELVALFEEGVRGDGLLRRLRADGSAVGLLSDGDPAVQGRKLDALGLWEAFDAIVVTGELGPDAGKPSPRGFEEVLRRLGDAPPGEAVYVSDNPAKDFVGARRAGMRSIRVRRPGGIYAALEPETPEHAPDAEVSGLDELPSALDRL